jgi:hypothetical protein
MNSHNNENILNSNIEIPLNILKEKILFCLPPNMEIQDDAIKVTSLALNHFFKVLVNKIHLDPNEEKKILVKDIKQCIENEEKFKFMRKLIEK